MSFEIKIDDKRLRDIQKEVEEEFYKNYKSQLRSQLSELLATEFRDHHGRVIRQEGAAKTQIREKVKAFLQSEKAQERLDRYIDQLFETEMQDVDEHVKKAFHKLFKKEAFQRLEQAQQTAS